MSHHMKLPTLLKRLKLSTIYQLWEPFAKEAIEQGWPPSRYLTALCEHESASREKNRLARRMKESLLPRNKSIETFEFSSVPSLNKAKILDLSQGNGWIEQGDNLLLFGPSGVGKTHLTTAIGKCLIESGYRVLFKRATEMIQNLQSAKRDLILPEALNKLDKYDCLILDDFGYVQKSEEETSLLFELICDRYERRSLIITCNQTFQEWDDIFSDKKMALAAIDRLVHHSIVIELNVESYRKKDVKKRFSKQNKEVTKEQNSAN